MVRLLLSFLVILFSCNSSNQDEKKNNFDIDPSQLGKLSFVNGDLDFGPVPIGTTHERLIQIKNTGKLPISDFETFYDDEEFSLIFRYSGQTAEFPGDNGTCGQRLDVNQTCLLSVSYLPTSSTTYDIEFKLRYKDGLGNSDSVMRIKSLSGTNGDLSVEPSIVNFGDIDLNDQAKIVVNLKNNGELDLKIQDFFLEQNGESLYNLDFNDTQTTCVQSNHILRGSEECNLAVTINTSLVSTYGDYLGYFEVNYLEAPTATELKTFRSDIRSGVYSLEGILETTPLLKYQDMISGSQRNISFQLRNIGHNGAVVKTVNSPVASNLNFNIDLSDCTNLADEIFNAPNEVIIQPGQICIMNATLSPDVSLATQAFSYPNLSITYDNLKTGLITTPDIVLEGDVTKSGFIDITDMSDVAASSWSAPTTFISNDSRINEVGAFKIKHNGETPITFTSFQLSGQGREYLTVSESCNLVLNLTEECGFNLTLNPSLTVYNSILETIINSTLTITYTDESIDLNGSFIERQVSFSVGGNLDLKSVLVFDEFDAGASRSNESVANSAVLEKIYVRNIGGLPESIFSIQISNPTNFSAVNTNIVDDDGERNCLDMINTGDSLSPQDQCFYELRSLATVNGNVSTNLEVVFGAGLEVSDPYALDTTYVNVAEIATLNVADRDKASYITYNGSYPGVGSSTSTGDASVSRKYSGEATVDVSQISVNTISTNFDLAVIDSGYGSIGSQDIVSFNIGNNGEYPLGINSVIVTTGSAVYKTASSCKTGTNVSSGSECTVSLDISYANLTLENSEIEIKYTLGDKASPDDVNFIEYTSYIKVYYQGYDSSSVANLNLYKSASPTSSLTLVETFGPDNTEIDDITFQNDGTQNATDIHYAILLNGTIQQLTGGAGEEIAFPNFVAGSSPIDEYFRNNSGVCNNASGNDINTGGDCTFDIQFSPSSLGITNYQILFRYFNGVTYVSEYFDLSTDGITPAKIELGQVLGTFPFYEHNFGGQVIDSSYSHEVSLTNTGETDALNFNHEFIKGSFELQDASTSSPTCTGTITAGQTCYLTLVFNPVFTNIGTQENRNFLANYETGQLSGAVNLTENIELNGIGLTENIRSKHYGWDEIYSMGFNQDFADQLNLNPLNNYAPEDLGFISFSWYSMDDVDGDADKYFIFKSDKDDIDIYNDSPIATINRDGSSIYSYVDENILNIPLKVWYYKIVPEKNGAISNILKGDYPVADLRIVVPNKFESLVHKYMLNREVCKLMDFTDTTQSSFDAVSNGCEYLDKNSSPVLVNFNNDLAVDMFETGSNYHTSNGLYNSPQDTPVALNFENALSHCESKEVTYLSSESIFSTSFPKTLPSRVEHMIYSAKISGETYDSVDCVYDLIDPLTGDALDCQSKFLIEQSIGGLPDWTTSEVSGFGKGVTTTHGGYIDDSIKNIDYTKHFQNISGLNYKDLKDPVSINNTCLNLHTGIAEREGALGCLGDNYAEFTDDPGSAGPKVFDISSEADNTRFGLWYFNADLSNQNITINAQAGGGQALGVPDLETGSFYTTEFVPSINPSGGARCVTRIGY